MKYFKEKLTLPSSLRDERALNLNEHEMMQKHLEEYRNGDKMTKLFSPINRGQEAPVKLKRKLK